MLSSVQVGVGKIIIPLMMDSLSLRAEGHMGFGVHNLLNTGNHCTNACIISFYATNFNCLSDVTGPWSQSVKG